MSVTFYNLQVVVAGAGGICRCPFQVFRYDWQLDLLAYSRINQPHTVNVITIGTLTLISCNNGALCLPCNKIFELTLCMLGNFSCFLLSSADFFQNQLFFINSFRNIIRVTNSLDLSVLIWVQTVCKDYQQTTKVSTIVSDLKCTMCTFFFQNCIPYIENSVAPDHKQALIFIQASHFISFTQRV